MNTFSKVMLGIALSLSAFLLVGHMIDYDMEQKRIQGMKETSVMQDCINSAYDAYQHRLAEEGDRTLHSRMLSSFGNSQEVRECNTYASAVVEDESHV